MFSANENIVLRQQKRRITSLIESTIPEDALDMGTMVMVMQVSCRAPGCVPLETAIAIVFPRGQKTELVPGLPESRSGGTFKTKVLMPMADVTNDDVLDALPPQFEGGRRTTEKLCLRARDVMLAQITQIMNEDDTEGKTLMAEYLLGCLKEYVDGGCKAPEVGEPFPTKKASTGKTAGGGSPDTEGASSVSPSGEASAFRRQNGALEDSKINTEESTAKPDVSEAVKHGVSSTGNFVVRRPREDNDGGDTSNPASGNGEGSSNEAASKSSAANASANDASTAPASASLQQPSSSGTGTSPSAGGGGATETATDWRRRQNMNRQVNAALASSGGGQSLIQRMTEREHAPGVRMAGCPCCDPDNPSNVVDNMMML